MKTPYPFQEIAIELGKQRNLLLNDECGCGKKLTCIEIARHVYTLTGKPVLVVTVKRDTRQWEREVHIQDPDIPLVIGTVDPIMLPSKDRFWLVLHYEALVRHVRPLSRVKWGAVILDEGHYIKNWQAQRSRAAKRLRAERKVVATGTPINKSPKDLWSPLEFLYPELYRDRKRAFEEKHVKAFIDANGIERILPGAKDPHALAVEIAPFTLARTKREVAPDLPPNILKHVQIDLTGAQAALYKRLKTSTDIEVCGPELDDPLFVPTRLALLLRLQQAAVDPALVGSNAEAAKLEWVRAWREGNPDEPLIVFTCFREVAKKLARDLNAHLIMGGVKYPDQFTRPTLVATIGAGAEALDLGWVRTAIFTDVTWKATKMQQALDRIDRLNKTEPSETIFLTATDTVDEVMLKAVQENWEEYELLRAYIAKVRGLMR